MARVLGALHSDAAQGHFKSRLTFSIRKGGVVARRQRAQKDVITPLRTAQRYKFNQGLILWNSLSDLEKSYWKSLANFLEVNL